MARKNFITKQDVQRGVGLFPSSLPEVFKEIYYYLYTNSNIPRAERLGAEMIRILFCKIYDERNNIGDFRINSSEQEWEVSAKVKTLFEKTKRAFPDAFDKDEKLYLDDKSIFYVVNRLQNHKIIGADRDVISEAFQAFWGPGLRGEKGQFFTPRNVVKLCVDILAPKAGYRIIDPACGSGGFLVECIAHTNTTDDIFGIDKEIDLAKICKCYMAIVGNGHSNIFCADSLDPSRWSAEMKTKIRNGQFDIVLTNPPFGARIPIVEKEILRYFQLGHKWQRIGKEWKSTPSISKQVPQVLFIERCLQLLKPGGRMAIVLPDGILGNPRDRYILQYVFEKAKVIAVVSLPPETFLPSTHTKTSVLFLEKKVNEDRDYAIFMGVANNVGHDKDGKVIYKMDEGGGFVFDESGQKIVDDDLPQIIARYKKFARGELFSYDRLGFEVKFSQIKDFILVPTYYDPEVKQRLIHMAKSGKYRLLTIGELLDKKLISIKRGHEIGSKYYGRGSIPFVRTSDIVNWEIKIDPIKCIPERVYEQYKKNQDVRENDILLVTDGTFLIGRTAIVTSIDKKLVLQSHIKRIRCLKPDELHPYLLLYLLNTDIVQRQIEEKTFVQATISTIGNRLYEITLPLPKDKEAVDKIITEVSEILKMKVESRSKIESLLKKKVELWPKDVQSQLQN